ncbi:MAG TPA: fused MFS/spermidine synthase [Gemmatimonadales bacterium]|nr:fused MFS/spermidine synthase [Gemmatimonadales bacterium]
MTHPDDPLAVALAERAGSLPRREARPLFALFFLSGLSGLVYELVFTKLLATIFGTTAYAAATVLAAFMGGLALGSAILSRTADRIGRPLRFYAGIEVAIGAYMLAVPALMGVVQAGYVAWNRAAPLSLAQLNLVRFVLGGAVVVVPTALMGATLPLLARHFARRGEGSGPTVAGLYAINTFGAAAGCFLANYLLLPWTGIYGALAAGALLNGFVGLRAWRLDGRGPLAAAPRLEIPEALAPLPARDRILLGAAFLTGLAAFSYEVVWTHLLSVVVGTSVYAFGDMLLALLLGIALGSRWIARHPAPPEVQFSRLARCQLGVGIAVVLTLPLWDHLPLFFKLVGFTLPGFYLREATRLAASLLVMLVPTGLMGVSFPLLIESLSGGERRLGRRVGSAYALNTIGAISGAVLTGFLLLPALGSRPALLGAAALSMLLGLALLWLPGAAQPKARLRWALAAAGLLLAGMLGLPSWNYKTLLSGYNVYFMGAPEYERILYVHEDVQSGMTSVALRPGNVIELRSNGKFEGDNRRQMEAQWGFALIPLMVSRGRERAAVIGLGTGVTAGTLARFPFRRIDVAELAPGIVEAARRFFADVNGGVLDDRRTHLYLEDGRNMLLLAGAARYDLVTVEVTSIWFAGAANLYSREFFQLVREHLAPGGVFQQWVQFHHIAPLDILRILNTLRQVFPHVTLWRSGGQGMLVASLEPIRADYASVMRMTALATRGPILDSLPLQHPLALFGDLLLDEAQVDSAIAFVSHRVGGELTRRLFVSSDMLPWLEYSTPRGNAEAMQYGATLKFFENYDAHRPPPIDGIPDAERDLIYGLAALRKGNSGNALRLLERAAAARPEHRGLAGLVAELRRRVEARPL